ncbi:hypothetical protein PAMP_011652 [Pampus punctatissimus]
MGSGESTTRKVSFGVDDEDRVRILRGVKLTEDVLQRMRGVANIAPEHTSSSSSSTTSTSPQKDTGASHSASSSSRPQQGSQQRDQPSSQSGTSKPASDTKEEQRRKPLEGRREQNDQLSRAGPPDAEGSFELPDPAISLALSSSFSRCPHPLRCAL